MLYNKCIQLCFKILFIIVQGNAFTKTQLYYDLHILDKSG